MKKLTVVYLPDVCSIPKYLSDVVNIEFVFEKNKGCWVNPAIQNDLHNRDLFRFFDVSIKDKEYDKLSCDSIYFDYIKYQNYGNIVYRGSNIEFDNENCTEECHSGITTVKLSRILVDRFNLQDIMAEYYNKKLDEKDEDDALRQLAVKEIIDNSTNLAKSYYINKEKLNDVIDNYKELTKYLRRQLINGEDIMNCAHTAWLMEGYARATKDLLDIDIEKDIEKEP